MIQVSRWHYVRCPCTTGRKAGSIWRSAISGRPCIVPHCHNQTRLACNRGSSLPRCQTFHTRLPCPLLRSCDSETALASYIVVTVNSVQRSTYDAAISVGMKGTAVVNLVNSDRFRVNSTRGQLDTCDELTACRVDSCVSISNCGNRLICVRAIGLHWEYCSFC